MGNGGQDMRLDRSKGDSLDGKRDGKGESFFVLRNNT